MFTGSLDDVLTDALVKNKVKFVELVLQQGVVMKEYLTVERLEKLYLEVNTLLCSTRPHYLVHQIRISEIWPWDGKSYLTHAILPRLSGEGYIHWLYWNSRRLLSSDIIVMLKWRHHVKLYLCVFRDFWKLIFKYKNSGEQEKESIICVRVG